MSPETLGRNRMITPVEQQTPTLECLFSAINSYQLTEAIKSAIELEILTPVSEGNTTSATIAKRCHASDRGVRILCDVLTIHNFLTKQGTTYALAADSALFLDRHSSASTGMVEQEDWGIARGTSRSAEPGSGTKSLRVPTRCRCLTRTRAGKCRMSVDAQMNAKQRPP